MTQPIVFISYSREDEAEKNALLKHLDVLQKAGLIDLWSDDQIKTGADWETEIEQAIARARVAVLLISADFLTSQFVLSQQVPVLLARRQSEGLVIFPVIAKACAWQRVEWLRPMKVRPRHGHPVWRESGRHVDEELATIADEVAAVAGELDPAPIVAIMGRYAPDQGDKLRQAAGPEALALAGEIFEVVLERIKEIDPRAAQKYPDNPEGYQVPLADALAELLQADLDFALRLKGLLGQYEQALSPAGERVTRTGSGVTVQGEGAVGIQQGDQGQVIIGSQIKGDVLGPGASKRDDE